MPAAEQQITEHLDLWTAAIKRKSSAGRGSSSKRELYGIKKLRELILELAVRGLLVAQDPQDEPASELLKKIAAEKARLMKERKIKKNKSFLAVSKEHLPYEAPNGWVWARIADIGYDFGQKIPDKRFIYIDVGSIDNKLGLIDSPLILDPREAPSRARKIVKSGTVIYSTVRPYLLNVAIVQKEFEPEPIASTAFAVIHPFSGIESKYVYRYLRSPSFVSYVESTQTGIAYPAINDRQFFGGLIPLPSTTEQRRIVAKVDELMGLCDQLEQQADASLSAHQALVEALLDALTSAADHAQFASRWQCIIERFDALFTTEESIDQLRQTILQLAVMGKLVAQDPKDEPASKLLKKIAMERAQLIKEKKIRRTRPLDGIADHEKFIILPAGWAFARLNDVGDWGAGATPSRNSPELYGGDIPWFKSGELVSDYISQSEETVTELALKKTSLRYNKAGDVLIAMYGATIGKAAILSVSATTNQAVCACTPFSGLVSTYLLLLLKAYRPRFIGMGAGGAQPNISREKIIETVIAVPPNAEQLRIVAKVDELMALCDQLKSRLGDAQATQLHLADAMTENVLTRN